jgi:Rrf2 family transcriptional regulator, nitric oxide-sensitive transcriptional repressor
VRLTSHSDYALRFLIYCALKPGTRVTIAEAAAAYGISRHHLMKIAQKLVLGNFLHSVRGRGGGLQLARPPHKINVGEVVRMMEADSLLVECFDSATNSCVIAPACGLKHLLARALEDFYRRLDSASLHDITGHVDTTLALFANDNTGDGPIAPRRPRSATCG